MNERGKQNLAYSNEPNVRRFLDMIQKAEGAKGYEYGFNNTKLKNLDDHPGISSKFTQTDGKVNTTDAAGKYQFMGKTWSSVRDKLGLTSFKGPEQEAAAVELIRGRGALDAVRSGDWSTALAKTGPEWASLPTSPYKQAKRSMDFVYEALGEKKPEGATFSEFFKNKNAMPTSTTGETVDTTTPWNAASSSAPPAAHDWHTNLVQEAQLADDELNKQSALHSMFADAEDPHPADDIALPPALRRTLSDIISSV
jgi:muramidase (phage lysozyme)